MRLALQLVGDGAGGKSDAAATLHEALNMVHQAYWREGEAIRSAKVLAEKDERAKTIIEGIARNFVETGEATDTGRVKNYAKLLTGSELTWKPSTSDEEAARWIPVRKQQAADAGARGGGGGGRAGALAGFYAQEARQFADGKRSVLDIRDAVSAEFGPVDSSKVLEYFKAQAAAFDLKSK